MHSLSTTSLDVFPRNACDDVTYCRAVHSVGEAQLGVGFSSLASLSNGSDVVFCEPATSDSLSLDIAEWFNDRFFTDRLAAVWASLVAHVFPATAPVSSLISTCSPSAVGLGVVAIVVDSIQRHLGVRPRAHVGPEILEGSPTVVDRDTAPSVVRVTRTLLTEASVEHHRPDSVFGRPGSAMCSSSLDGRFVSKAPAGLRSTESQVVAVNNLHGSTIAAAQVRGSSTRCVPWLLRNPMEHEPSVEFLARSVDKDSHLAILLDVNTLVCV